MAIQGTDQRSLVTNFSADGNSSVVAIDALRNAPTATVPQRPDNLVTTGIQIGNNFFLTAGHCVFDAGSSVDAGRITAAQNVGGLPSRPSTTLSPADVNFTASSISYPDNYPASSNFDRDIALIRTTAPVGAASIGMLVFANAEDAKGISITTMGFPAAFNAPGTITTTPADPVLGGLNQATFAYTSSGSVRSASASGEFEYTDDVDTEGGQSGSGVWTTVDDGTGQQVTVVVGVHTNSRNGGHLITSNEYLNITNTMEAAEGNGAAASAAALPENVIMGSESGFFSFFTGSGDDYIQGSYRREAIFGRGGDDRLEGGGADDRLFGGEGVDQSLYSGFFTEYDFTINDFNVPEFTFTHARGAAVNGTDTVREVEFAVFEYEDSDRDGSDDDGNVFFVPLQADEDDPTKLADGPGLTYEAEVRASADADAALIGTFSADLPAFTFDGDLDYELTIGAEQSILYNFAYIVDVSGSMFGTNLSQTQAAYEALTNYLIADGIAARSNFAVIPFESSATLISGIDAQGAISAINSLSASGGTEFGSALSLAENWFESLDTVGSATNIAYFLSDGQGSGASSDLQVVDETLGFGGVAVDVRAFGIGSGASLSSLDTIDSNSAQLLGNPSDLISAFGSSGISRTTIDRIEVLLAGVVVDTIAPTALTDDPLGLRYEGTLNGLDVGREADNDVAFRLVFNDGTPTAELDARVTSGQEEVVEQSDDGTEVQVTFSVSLRDYDATALAESLALVANDLSNTISLGDSDATVESNGGDDTIIMGSGSAVIDGGDGIDTVRFGSTRDAAGAISRSGDVVSVGSQASLVNVEFIAFEDAIVDAQTLEESLIVSLDQTAVRIGEGDAGAMVVQFTLSVAQAATSDIVISFATRDGEAEAGTDYTGATGQALIEAGQTEATVTLEVNGDVEVEASEDFFIDFTTDGLSLFTAAQTTATSAVEIQADDSRIDLIVVGDRFSFFEGDEGTASSPGLSLFRNGAIDFAETVTYAIEGVGPNAVEANDFATPMTGTVTFAAGEDTVSMDVAVVGDTTIETAESFRILFEGANDGSSIDQTSSVFTIENDDEGTDDTAGTDGDDDIFNPLGGQTIALGAGADVVRGPVENFFEDVIEDFGFDDSMVFEGASIARSAIEVTFGSAIFDVDTDGDASSNGQFTLEGDFSAGDFMAVGDSGDTLVTFETFLPVLQERQAVDPELVNGIINQNFLKGDGATDFRVTLRDLGLAGHDNAVGVYEIDNAGNIVDTRILFGNANADKTASTLIEDVEDGHNLGFFIVQDAADWAATLATSDTLSFVNSSGVAANISDGAGIVIAVNGAAIDEMVFHSFDGNMNSDGLQHTLSGVDVGGEAITVGFEDLTGGGDRDYEDVVFRVELVDDALFV